MAVSIADLIASGLPVVGAVNAYLTGVVRREFVSLELMDKEGKTREVSLQLEPAFSGGPVFDVLSVDLLNAIEDYTSKSDAALNAITFSSEVRDHTPDVTTIDDTSNVNEVAVIKFSTALGRDRSMRIPSPLDSLSIDGAGGTIDQVAIADLVAEFTGEGLTTRTFLIDNIQPIKIKEAKRTTYKTR